MRSKPVGSGMPALPSQVDSIRDDARASGFLIPHQQLGVLALGTNPTNGQVVPIVINGTTITATFVTSIGTTANNILIGASALVSVTNLLNWLRRPDQTNANQVAASGANQALLQYVGWAWPGSSTNIVPFSLNKNVNGLTGPLTSFNITGITVTSGSWTAATLKLYVEDGTYYIGGTRYLFTGGSTSAVTAPSSHPRIDVLTIDNTGTLNWTTGTENASPVAPTYPANQVPICELYNVVSETALYDNENQQSGQGYIYNDVRPTMNTYAGAGLINGAWLTSLASIPSGAGVIPVVNIPANSYNSQSFTAATNITKGQALILGTGVSGYLTQNNQMGTTTFAMGQSGSGDLMCQSFTTSSRTSAIRAVMVKTATNNSAAGTYGYTATLYAANGSNQPTGSALGSATATLSQNSTQTVTLTFPSSIAVSPSTTYCLVISSGSSGINGNTTTGYYNNAAGYSSQTFSTSTNNGTSWSSSTSYSLYYEVWEVFTISGQVQPSDTTQTLFSGDNYDLAYNFCGFALSSVSAGATVGVNFGPVDADQTGLTAGVEYYLNGASGALGTTAGAISVKVGIAMSATWLLIKFTNYP